MRRGTTPTLKIKINNVDLQVFEKIIVTFKKGEKMINKEAEIEDEILILKLSQEETLDLCPGSVSVQIKGKTNNGNVVASEIKNIVVEDILNEEIL